MKKKNIIVSSIALLGAVTAIGTSFALYKVMPEDQTANIGINTTADVNYQISAVTTDNEALRPNVGEETGKNVDTFGFNIHGVRNESSVFNQPYVLAQLTVTITPDQENENKALFGEKVTVAGDVGYKEGTFFANNDAQHKIGFGEADPTTGIITGTLTTYIYVGANDDWSVAPGEGVATHNPVNLTVTLDDTYNGASFVENLAEMTYTVDISLGEASDFDVAYLTGDMNGWVTNDDTYQMVANIEATTAFEWMWLGTLPENTQFKGYKYDTKAEEGKREIWSAGDNAVAQATMQGAYWNGGSSDTLNVDQ